MNPKEVKLIRDPIDPASVTPAEVSPKPASVPEEKIASVHKNQNQNKDSPKPWSGQGEFGFRQQDGRRDSTNFDFRASANRKLKDNAFTANARLLYGEQEWKINNNRYDSSFRWRRELGERTFVQSATSYSP
ncbi:MAG: DUF481 domain-containing protein [Candidatus Synoicihabitans palmerolidicus]|nr:DUF481 domain-containing protein [Candidatus Synoicihabitans palmerolidicus]